MAPFIEVHEVVVAAHFSQKSPTSKPVLVVVGCRRYLQLLLLLFRYPNNKIEQVSVAVLK